MTGYRRVDYRARGAGVCVHSSPLQPTPHCSASDSTSVSVQLLLASLAGAVGVRAPAESRAGYRVSRLAYSLTCMRCQRDVWVIVYSSHWVSGAARQGKAKQTRVRYIFFFLSAPTICRRPRRA